jgi:hypothetical protein
MAGLSPGRFEVSELEDDLVAGDEIEQLVDERLLVGRQALRAAGREGAARRSMAAAP